MSSQPNGTGTPLEAPNQMPLPNFVERGVLADVHPATTPGQVERLLELLEELVEVQRESAHSLSQLSAALEGFVDVNRMFGDLLDAPAAETTEATPYEPFEDYREAFAPGQPPFFEVYVEGQWKRASPLQTEAINGIIAARLRGRR